MDPSGLVKCTFNCPGQCGYLTCYAEPGDLFATSCDGGDLVFPVISDPQNPPVIFKCPACTFTQDNTGNRNRPGEAPIPYGNWTINLPSWRNTEKYGRWNCRVNIGNVGDPVYRKLIGIHSRFGDWTLPTWGCIRMPQSCLENLGLIMKYSSATWKLEILEDVTGQLAAGSSPCFNQAVGRELSPPRPSIGGGRGYRGGVR